MKRDGLDWTKQSEVSTASILKNIAEFVLPRQQEYAAKSYPNLE